ncbi:MAG: 4-alpha-glucanotransferase [Mycobacteriales bacterium]
MSDRADPLLVELASAYGVACSYQDSLDRTAHVDGQTVVAVLRALGVEAGSPAAVTAALDQVRHRTDRTSTHVARIPPPQRRSWGWMVQLYNVRSAGSWGIGDYHDLADIVRWSGSAAGGGAGLVLCNPLHAMTPTLPLENSPYFPSSRRFRSPLYLRIADLAEYARCDAATRSRVEALRPPAPDLIDRDAVWTAKLAALELLWPYADHRELEEFRTDQGAGLDDFAVFCVLAEEHGPDWRTWPPPFRDPTGPEVERIRQARSDRISFHTWLQLLCDAQLATASAAAAEAGMPVGIVHDLAVGVDPGGADAWALQDVLVPSATVGCPADLFNQLGQDWQLPPWHPARLAAVDYQPFREMVRSVLRHAGGIRIDHVMGLFRLWWIPEGQPATRGAYVSYDWQALARVLAEEAARTGAVVIGEDLGTVEPRVVEALSAAGILGCDVAWFKREGGGGAFLPPQRWRTDAIASVTTHDLPTVAGWFTGDAVRVRAELGQLDVPVEQERARAAADRTRLIDMLVEQSLLSGDPSDLGDVTLALHRLLVAAPSVLVVAALGDAVADMRQPNLPGTRDEYPNWRLPLADDGGNVVTLEEFRRDPRVGRLIDVLRGVGAPAAASGTASDTVTA